MKQIHKGGNANRNLGLLLLLAMMTLSFISASIFLYKDNESWFSRAALASILLGLYLIADKEDTKSI